MGDLGLRGKRNQLAFKAQLLPQEPGAAALLTERTEHRASGDKLNNLSQPLQHTAIRAVRTGNTIKNKKHYVFPL